MIDFPITALLDDSLHALLKRVLQRRSGLFWIEPGV
jgi:hypothetical protein